MEKTALLAAIVERLEGELALLQAAAKDAKAEATDAESRQEGKYDMRGQTAAYLAEGQARMAAELGEAIAAYRALAPARFEPAEPVGLGAIVALEAEKRRALYFVGPSRGGLEVEVGGSAVTVITAGSPLGSRVVGRRAGDTVVLPSGRDRWKIVSVE